MSPKRQKAGLTRTTSSASESSESITLPAELITLISRLFDSAGTLLSYALIDKRHHSLSLAYIKDRSNKQGQELLALYARKIIKVIEEDDDADKLTENFGKVYIYSILPNFIKHGTQKGWLIPKNFIPNLVSLCDHKFKDPSHPENTGEENDPKMDSVTSYIIDPEKQEQAWALIQQEGKLADDGMRKLGKEHGNFKAWRFVPKYEEDQDSEDSSAHEPSPGEDKMVLIQDYNYFEGEWHGECRTFDDEGKLTGRKYLNQGKLEGIQRERSEDETLSVTNYQSGEVVEEEVYKYDDDDYPLLVSRKQYKNNAVHGCAEGWEYDDDQYSAGIRTSLEYYINGELDGTSEEFDAVTGVKIKRAEYKKGKKHGLEETWDENSGTRTTRVNWKNDKQDGLEEAFHYETGELIHSKMWKNGKRR